MKQPDATTMTRYLLGKLPETDRAQCEQEWFTDKAKYVQLCEAENTLIDEYVRGALSGEERTLFEQHFLTIPTRRERVQTAAALVKEIDQPAAPAESWWQRVIASLRTPKLIPAVAMAALLIAGGLWLFWQSRQLREQVAKSATAAAEQQSRVQELEQSLANERAANARLTQELARTQAAPQTPQPPLPTTLLFTLTAGVLRSDSGGALHTLKLAKGLERVKLLVNLPANEYARFAAALRTAEGNDLTRWRAVNAAKTNAGARLTLELSAKNLRAGDYVLVIRGINARREVEEFRRLPFKVSQ